MAASWSSARRSRSPTSTSRARRSTPTRRRTRKSPAISTRSQFGTRSINSRAYCGWFGFRGSDQQKKIGLLSGGERNRLHLAKLLKTGGNLLLLDEPTNDLDVDTLARTRGRPARPFPAAPWSISHDRWFLDRIATHILAFEGDSEVTWFEGNYPGLLGGPEEAEGDQRRPAPPDQVPETDALTDQRMGGFESGLTVQVISG